MTKAFLIFSMVFVSCLASMPGGWTKQDPNDPKYMEMAWSAVADINAEHAKTNGASDKPLVPRTVLSAESQVVAGMNYKVDVEVGESECSSNGAPTQDSCTLVDGGASHVYTIHKFEQPWTNTEEVTVTKKN